MVKLKSILTMADEETEKKYRILVVDDEESIRGLFEQVLSPEYEVITAEDGEKALELLSEKGDADLVFTDLQMPKMDGFEFIEAALSRGSNADYIIISAYNSTGALIRTKEVGALDIIPKPIDIKLIKELADRMTGRKEKPSLKEIQDGDLETRVLVVDDDETFRKDTKSLLEIHGYAVDETGTIDDALARLNSKNYDVSLIGIFMNEIRNGIDLLREINKGGIDTWPIIMSGLVTVENQEKAYNEGAVKVIQKDDKFNSSVLNAMSEAMKKKKEWDSYVKSMEETLNIPNLAKRIHDEQLYTAQATGGRRMENITRQEALRRVCLTKKVLLIYDKDKGPELEERLRKEFNVVSSGDISYSKKNILSFNDIDMVLIDSSFEDSYYSEEKKIVSMVEDLKLSNPNIPMAFAYSRKESNFEDIKLRMAGAGAGSCFDVDEKFEDSIKNILKPEKKEEMSKITRTASKNKPYLLVFIGPTCSGKTTTAINVEKILNERGDSTVYIGNIKTGEPRKGEIIKGRDTYVTEKVANELEKDSSFKMYKMLGRRYFSKDAEIIEELKKGNNVIVVRNVAGLKAAGELIYRHKDELPIKLISYKLHASEDVLKERLEERLDRVKSITPDEYEERRNTLKNTIIEHVSAPVDRTISTDKDPEKTWDESVGFMDWIDDNSPNLHFEFSNYTRDIIRKITDNRFYTRKEFENEIKKSPIIVETKSLVIPKLEIVHAKGYNGIYTFYLNPFYSQENIQLKEDFLNYITKIVGDKADRFDPAYGPDPVSDFAKTKLFYTGNYHPIRLDDIALFTINKGISAEFAGDEYHTAVFVCLEHSLKEGSQIESKEI